MIRTLGKVAVYGLGTLALAACGGGGGGGGGGNGDVTPPPPPPQASVTYELQLTDLDLVDQRTAEAVDASGLPIDGATATRNP